MASQMLETVIQMIRSAPDLHGAPIEQRRAAMEAVTWMLPVPNDVKREPVDADGVPGEWISAPGADPDRVIYYLHGGGYSMGSIKTHREMVSRIWINRDGIISINDKLVSVDNIEAIIVTMIQEKPTLIIAFNADDRCPYSVVSDVMDELKKANAVRVSFTSDPESASQPSKRR